MESFVAIVLIINAILFSLVLIGVKSLRNTIFRLQLGSTILIEIGAQLDLNQTTQSSQLLGDQSHTEALAEAERCSSKVSESNVLIMHATHRTIEDVCDELAHQYDLTSRECDVLKLLAQGFNAAKIAEALVVSRSTAKSHIAKIYQKLSVHSQQELLTSIHAELDVKCA